MSTGTAKARPLLSIFLDIGIKTLRRWSRRRGSRKLNASHGTEGWPLNMATLSHNPCPIATVRLPDSRSMHRSRGAGFDILRPERMRTRR